MAKYPTEPDPEAWQRFFAISANNRAWDLSVSERSPEEDQEMLNQAHAAALHWGAVGTELNAMRATMLLAEVHALLDMGPSALSYAQQMYSYFTGRDETPDWELAFAHGILAHAAFAAGDAALHASAYADAQRALDAISDEKDRAIVDETMAFVPAPS